MSTFREACRVVVSHYIREPTHHHLHADVTLYCLVCHIFLVESYAVHSLAPFPDAVGFEEAI
jgi:hypothetical protein